MRCLKNAMWCCAFVAGVSFLHGDDSVVAGSGSEVEVVSYEVEQARLDLPVCEAQLAVLHGEISQEEAQTRIEKWLKANEKEIAAQEKRLLDWLKARPAATEEPQVPALFEGLAQGDELVRLESEEQSVLGAFRARAADDAEWHGLVEEWLSGEGGVLQQKKISLWEEVSALRPLGTQPIIVEVAEDAGEAALATLDYQENTARRLQAIRHAHPEADKGKMQELIAEQEEAFAADAAAITKLLKEEEKTKLARRIGEMKALLNQ